MFFIGVSNSDIVQVLSVYEDASKGSNNGVDKEKWITVPLKLKGIRNLSLLAGRHLVVETNT